MTPSEIHDFLKERFDDAVLGYEEGTGQPWIEVDPLQLETVARALKDGPALDFDRLLCLSGIDWEGYDDKGKGKHRAIAQYAEDGTVQDAGEPGTGDLGVAYHLQSRVRMHQIVLKVRLPREAPRVQSVSGVWTTAAWGERETYDFYGIEFLGHPDLRRLFLPEDWEGWPLRKDYAMPAIYHDVPLEGLPLAVRAQQEYES